MTAIAALAYFVALLFVHWFGDFVLQTHWQSINKSKQFGALAAHVGTYTVALLAGSLSLFGTAPGVFDFVAANCILHLATDYVTSRWTRRLWAKAFPWDGLSPVVRYPPPDGAMHNFFVAVGFDQFLHHAALAATFAYFILPRG